MCAAVHPDRAAAVGHLPVLHVPPLRLVLHFLREGSTTHIDPNSFRSHYRVCLYLAQCCSQFCNWFCDRLGRCCEWVYNHTCVYCVQCCNVSRPSHCHSSMLAVFTVGCCCVPPGHLSLPGPLLRGHLRSAGQLLQGHLRLHRPVRSVCSSFSMF